MTDKSRYEAISGVDWRGDTHYNVYDNQQRICVGLPCAPMQIWDRDEAQRLADHLNAEEGK